MAAWSVSFVVEMTVIAPNPDAAARFAAETVAMREDGPLSLHDARLVITPADQDPFAEPAQWTVKEDDFERMVVTAMEAAE